ncbi:MAG TPA: hypothetical protein PLQ57_11220 [Saprospiraceae bacterium]|nr:hypothetical protein [Saprospiraceae bacterium]HRG66647.1 hypothetical protein [Saprospiraceae bacterium]
MKKSKDKIQNKPLRAHWWDYSCNASYFVTICTRMKFPYFGEVKDQKMILNELGRCAEICWYDIPNHFPFVELGEFVVMPDHIHGILTINKPSLSKMQVESQNIATPQSQHGDLLDNYIGKNKFGPQSKNLASVIRGYKIGVTKKSKSLYPNFKWQTLYYDHIIRNETDLKRIVKYILDNPMNWGKKRKVKPQKHP